jgi:predicted dehydrogenase
MVKLALIGCGAIAESHLRAAIASGRVAVTTLVDKSLPRARKLGEKYGITSTAEDYRDIIGKVDACVVALPHHLHCPVAVDLLRNGIHVLVEKPMAMTARECDEMIAAAREASAVLAVGLIRRFYAPAQFIKNAVDTGLLGEILRFDARIGSVYNWPVASDFTFRKETGGGVLPDTGPHTVDILLWWLGDYESLEYYDDAVGGVEADCEIRLRLKSGASGIIELSRTRDLRNTFIIEGRRAIVEMEGNYDPLVRLTMADDRRVVFSGRCKQDDTAVIDPEMMFRQLMNDFAEAIAERRPPRVPGEEGKRSVELIENCYAHKQPLTLPWTAHPSLSHR